MSLWWFDQLRHVVPNHVISTDVPPEVAGRGRDLRAPGDVSGRVRGAGLPGRFRSGATTRRRRRSAASPLPEGLDGVGSRLPEPIFTPATKAAVGDHDENVDYDDRGRDGRGRRRPPSCGR